MLAEINAGISSLKAAKDVIQSLHAVSSAVAINEVKINLQGLILEAQEALFAAQQNDATMATSINRLEEQIVRLKDWSAEKEHYQLHAIDGRAFAYKKKTGMDGGEPPHWLCANCFDNRQIKSILQFAGQATESVYRCANCDAQIRTRLHTIPEN